jgi:hypothetical protein
MQVITVVKSMRGRNCDLYHFFVRIKCVHKLTNMQKKRDNLRMKYNSRKLDAIISQTFKHVTVSRLVRQAESSVTDQEWRRLNKYKMC